jgi:hypothetical protein
VSPPERGDGRFEGTAFVPDVDAVHDDRSIDTRGDARRDEARVESLCEQDNGARIVRQRARDGFDDAVGLQLLAGAGRAHSLDRADSVSRRL